MRLYRLRTPCSCFWSRGSSSCGGRADCWALRAAGGRYFPVGVAGAVRARLGVCRGADNSSTDSDSSSESDVWPMPSNSDSSAKDTFNESGFSPPVLDSSSRYFIAVVFSAKSLFLFTPLFDVPIPSNRSIISEHPQQVNRQDHLRRLLIAFHYPDLISFPALRCVYCLRPLKHRL